VTWRTGLRRAAITLAILLGLTILLAGFVFFTQPGTRLAVRAALEFAPASFTIGGIDGTLRSPLELRDIRFANDSVDARIGLVHLRWTPWALLRNELHLDTLLVTGINVGLNPEAFAATDPTTPPPPPDTAAPPPAAGPLEPPVAIVFDHIEVEIDSIDWGRQIKVSDGHLVMHGRHDAYALETRAVIDRGPDSVAPPVPHSTMSLKGTGSLSHFDLEQALVETLRGAIRATGRASWDSTVAWSLAVDGTDLHPALIASDTAAWPGMVGFRFHTEGTLDSTGPRGVASLDTLSGNLRSYPLAGSASFQMAGPRVIMSTAHIAWGRTRIEGTGTVADSVNLDFTVDMPDVGMPVPGAAGRLGARIQAHGARATPLVRADFTAQALALDSNSVRTVRGRLGFDMARDTGSANVRLDGMRAGAQLVDSVRIALLAQPDSLRGSVVVTGGGAGTDLGVALELVGAGVTALRGLADSMEWRGTLTRVDLRLPIAGEWSLDRPARLVAARDHASLDTLCLSSEGAGACVGGSWRALGEIAISAHLEGLQLARFQKRYPAGMELSGTASADADLTLRPDSTFTGTTTADVKNLSLRYTGGLQHAPVELAIRPAAITLHASDSGTAITATAAVLDAAGKSLASVDLNVELPGFHHTAPPDSLQPVTGRVQAASHDLSWLNPFMERVTGLGGALAADITLGGTAGKPGADGGIHLTGVAATIPGLGLTLSGGRFDVVQDNAQGLAFSGSVMSGGGTMTVQGSTPWVPGKEHPGRVTLTGDQFQVVNSTQVRVVASPAIDVAFTMDSVDVKGKVTIPSARVELVEVPPTAVAVSPDIVIVDTLGKEPPPALKTTADLELVLGQDVFFSGFGFTSFLEGQLRVQQTTNEIATGTGEIRFREGRFYSYGQNLTIHDGTGGKPQGAVRFAGPVDNPGLALKAYRIADDGTEAGLDVSGPLKEPRVVVYSDPALPQASAISYLMFGRGMDESSSAQKQQAANAALYLGGNVVATRMASKVGLDEARIEPGASGTMNDASLMVGKYLSPKLYASYGMGLFDRASRFRLRYLVNRSLSFQTESGVATGADVFYRFERGRGGQRQR
jgi:translocation and assembly module TamB